MGFICTKDKSKLIFKRKYDGRIATYDLADASMYNFQGRKVKSLNSFFVNSSFNEITWEDENYREFVNNVNKNNSRISNVGSMLSLLHQYRHNEGYILLGLPIRGRMEQPISDYPKAVRKFLLNKFKDSRRGYDCTKWCKSLANKGSNKIAIIQTLVQLDLEYLVKDVDIWEMNVISDLVKDYNMDLKALLLKIAEYVRREGLSFFKTLTELQDYNSMSQKMTTKYQKYPKYLLSTHQITVRNYNAFREEYEEEAFLRSVDHSLSHKGTTYTVLTAKSSQDVKDEGANQHHCVASYVSSIINGSTQIVFMRLNKKLDKSLLTIEVKENKIIQVKGSYNRGAMEDELKFIHTYANQHKLTVGKYL